DQETVLQAAGFSFADLVLTKIYLANPAAYTDLNEAYKRFVTAPPPARATIHATPLRAGELLQIQSIAVRGSGTGRPSGQGHTSPIHSFSVKAGHRLYITGMTGRGPDGKFAPEIQAQARLSLATIAEQLDRNGMGFADVVETTVWLQNLQDYDGMRALLPASGARTVVRIPPSSKEALVEIQMVAERSTVSR
ncbi:MAG: RidA family protein, partial [Bryobacteraceae bacterium]